MKKKDHRKGTVFFFSVEKIVPSPSLKSGKICIFFFRKSGKKNTAVFFFPGKDYIPLTQLFSVRSKFGQITIDLKTVFFQNSPALKMANVFFKKIRCLGADCVKIL